jgi:N-acetylglucosaminyl-diphospho-decaprenol L-rhamnosyltransferase
MPSTQPQPAPASLDLGIVIVNWNVRDLLADCLYSVYADLNRDSALRLAAKVCVVDNGSTDGSVEMLRARFTDTQLIVADNRGMGAGNNLGLQALGFRPPASAPPPEAFSNAPQAPFAALILNPDTRVQPGALRALVDFLRTHPQAGVVAPKLLNADGTLQHSGFRFPGFGQAALDLFPPPGRLNWIVNSRLNGRYPPARYAGRQPFRVEHTLGAAFAVRAAAVAQCGWFDEAFQLYCEEIDWQWRLARAGWQCWIEPGAEIVHYGGQSTSQAAVRVASFRQLWQSRRQLYARYYSPALVALLAPLVRWAMRRRLHASPRADQQDALREIIAAWGPGPKC